MARMLKNFTKKFMHGEGSSSGGGRSREEHTLVPYAQGQGIKELVEAADNVDNQDGAEQAGGQQGRGGRRGARSGRTRRGVGRTSSRAAELNGCIDPNLSPAKVATLTNFRILPEGEVHVSTQTSLASRNIRSRGSLANTLRYFHSKLAGIDRVVAILHELGFHHFLGISNVIKGDVQLCAAIALRWYKTTHTFHFPCGELGITPFDFSMLTGISIGVTAYPPIPYDSRWRDVALVNDLLPHLDTSPECYQASSAIRVSAITAAMDSILSDYSSEHDLELARLFVLYLMGNLFFSTTSSSLSVDFIEAVSQFDYHTAVQYDWGTPILAYLYRCLDTQCTISDSQVSLYGFWELLQYWYFEYSHNFNFITQTTDPSDFFHRLTFWTSTNRGPRDNESRHVYSIAHNQIDLRMYRGQIIWHPFDSSISIDVDFIQIARMLSDRRFPLLSYPLELGAYWYLGERCWRQFHDHDAIPDDPHPHTYRCMIYPIDQLDMARTAGWWPAGSFVIVGPSYVDFWRRFYSTSADTITHAAAIDLIGPSAIRHGIAPPVIEDLTQPSQGYRAPDHVAAASHFGWNMVVSTTSGVDRYVDIYHPPAHDHYSDPSQISYADLYDMQMGMRHTSYVEHRRSIDYYNAEVQRQTAEAARLQALLESERQRFAEFGMYYDHLAGPSGDRDTDAGTRPHRRPRRDD